MLFRSVPGFSYGQNAADRDRGLKQLSDQQRWSDIVRAVESQPERDAESDFYYGIALAQLGRLEEAYRALLAGRRLQAQDKRFPIELGGVRFREKRYGEAARWVRRALRIDPLDAYANDLLATIYFLEDNLPAALKYWNRIGKPQVQQVHTPAELRIKPALLDRSFAFAPASLLRVQDLLTSEKRVRGLGVFPHFKFQLLAQEEGTFDVNFRAREKDGFAGNRWATLLSTFAGIFYQTVYPEYFNLRGDARNITSLLRWDAQKRRLWAAYSSPLEGNPRYRYQFALDARNENWDIVSSAPTSAAPVASLNLRKEAFRAGLSSFLSGRWDWSMGAELSHRGYRNLVPGSALGPAVLLRGYELKHIARLDYELLHLPEKRWLMAGSVSAETASIFSKPAHAVEKLEASLLCRWFGQMQSDDYGVHEQVRTGRAIGQLPFDELFMLGLERDNDLSMRAHLGARDGRKGTAPLGRRYWLSNAEVDKNIYNNGVMDVKLTPFLDSGKISDPLAGLGSKKWLFDTGVAAKFRVLGVGFTFTYGKDLRSGKNVYYFIAVP